MLYYLFFGLLFTVAHASEMIVTSDFAYIEKAANYLSKDDVVLFDVDATLINPCDAILQPVGKALFKQLVAICPERDLFREIRMTAPHLAVDKQSLSFIKKLQARQVAVIAFTAAPAKIHTLDPIGTWRVDELRSYGFDFSKAFPSHPSIELPKSEDAPHTPFFKEGVLYSSFHPKGDILCSFLQAIQWRPKKVVFIDDEYEHVISVINSLELMGIDCCGIHYTAALKLQSPLDPDYARFQVQHFIENDVWLTDNPI